MRDLLRGLPWLLAGLLCACSRGAQKSVELKASDGFTLTKPLSCAYLEGQSMTDLGRLRIALKQKPNSSPIVWSFDGLFKLKTLWRRGTQAGEAVPYVSPNSVSLLVPMPNGMQVFTVWSSGVSVWSKHDTVGGLLGANQFLGLCENI